ncbi:hypothetical protein Sango_1363100 [Sesamum angolense]|uniref:Uncharacterized protein n=1 Tax=Sesamum angolense TaxID=2727404 RepID=A0AAE1WSU7_9LAMI|nr:hypothetical protein Sango_1363100 [Sesamum angolense]
MEGVGARLGRSSTRYGPATVFTGPVRKWKKKWVHVPPSSSNHHHQTSANGTVNGSNGSSHLLLYKWTPITPSQNKDSNNSNNGSDNSNNGNADSKTSNKDDAPAAEEPRENIQVYPVIVLEEQKNESSEQIEEDANQLRLTRWRQPPRAQENNPVERHDLNESTLDLSLGLKAHDGENESDQKADQMKDNRLE